MPYDKHYRLPSHEVAHRYTEAMYFGQQMEINLRAILYTADYHGWGSALVLSVREDIRRAARNGGILKDADERARAQLTSFFRQMGFEKIEFRAR